MQIEDQMSKYVLGEINFICETFRFFAKFKRKQEKTIAEQDRC